MKYFHISTFVFFIFILNGCGSDNSLSKENKSVNPTSQHGIIHFAILISVMLSHIS
jgi:hypothetical protein